MAPYGCLAPPALARTATSLQYPLQVKGRIALELPFGLFQAGADAADDERLLIVQHQLLKACRFDGQLCC